MNLPKVFQNKNIRLESKENKKIKPKNNIDINNKINNLFKQTNYVYKINVIIETSNNIEEHTIIGKTNNYLLTLENKKIPIKDIIDINEKK